MGIRTNYNHTLYASYTGYITQAVVNTFIPLLFLTFQSTYQIPLDKITLLVTVNFAIQLTVDLLSANSWTKSATAFVLLQRIFLPRLG